MRHADDDDEAGSDEAGRAAAEDAVKEGEGDDGGGGGEEEEEEEEGEEEVFFNPDLFVDEDSYEKDVFVVGSGLRVQLFSSHAASTDFDLTGQVVWPVSVMLAWFVHHTFARARPSVVLELGAGCGLAGLTAAYCRAVGIEYGEAETGHVVLTDGNDVAVRLLERNVSLQRMQRFAVVDSNDEGGADQSQEPVLQAGLSARHLLWGDRAAAEAVLRDIGPVDVLLGADVVCWSVCVKPLVQTVKFFMQRARDPAACVFLLGFVCRASNIQTEFFGELQAQGLQYEELALDFLPDPVPEQVRSTRQLQLFRITLDMRDGTGWSDEVQFESDEGQALPC